MFKCEIGKETVGPYIKPIRVVVEVREKRYPPRLNDNDPGGYGEEIVREINVCSEHAKGIQNVRQREI